MRKDEMNIFETIVLYNNDNDFEPRKEPAPTDSKPKTVERLELYRSRLMAGEDLYLPHDNNTPPTPEDERSCSAYAMSLSKQSRKEARQQRAEIRNKLGVYRERVRVDVKDCKRCKKIKPAEEFYHNKLTRDGLATWCKACKRKYDIRRQLEG